MGGERRAALADDAGVLDDLHQLLGSQAVGVRHGLDFLGDLVLEVVFNDHGHHLAAHREGTGLHGLDRAGDAGVDGCGNESAGFADPLSNFYLVAHRNDRLARRTDVHRHGNDHLSRGCQLFDGLFIGRGLHVIGMNAAKESLCHCLHLILLPGGTMPPHTISDITTKLFSCPAPRRQFLRFFAVFVAGLTAAAAGKARFCRFLPFPPRSGGHLCFRRHCVRILPHRAGNAYEPRAERRAASCCLTAFP